MTTTPIANTSTNSQAAQAARQAAQAAQAAQATTDNQHKVTTASKPAPLNAQPRPPIPASVPESKSAALVAVENLRAKVDAQGATLEAITLQLHTHIKDSTKGYTELHAAVQAVHTEITALHGVLDYLRSIMQAPATDLDTHFGTAKITARAAQPGPADIAEAERDNAPRGIEGWCRIHDCAMQAREKDGHTWYSHKAPDDSWCRGDAKKGKK